MPGLGPICLRVQRGAFQIAVISPDQQLAVRVGGLPPDSQEFIHGEVVVAEGGLVEPGIQR